MVEPTEAQEQEMIALEALFTHEGEFERVSPTSFKLALLPFPENSSDSRTGVTLLVTYPPTYPETSLPNWALVDSKGLDEDALDSFRNEVEAEMKAELGAPMMYNVAEFIQEWLRQRLTVVLSKDDKRLRENSASSAAADEQEGAEEQRSSESEEEPEVDSPSNVGLADKHLCDPSERCTKEEFDRWAQNFRREMIAKDIWKGSCVSGSARQRGIVTGKMLFEHDNSLAAADTEEAGENMNNIDNDKRNNVMWKDESLFAGGQDTELLSD